MRGSFYEAEHLGGDTDMVAVIAEIVAEERRRAAAGRADVSIPFRPDHGQDILDDLKRKAQPGYPAIGRLKGLAELRGIMTALTHPDARTARMTPPIPVALVGVGKIARDQHIPAIAADPDFTLVAGVSRHATIDGVPNFADLDASSPTARRRWSRSACRRRPAPRWR